MRCAPFLSVSRSQQLKDISSDDLWRFAVRHFKFFNSHEVVALLSFKYEA